MGKLPKNSYGGIKCLKKKYLLIVLSIIVLINTSLVGCTITQKEKEDNENISTHNGESETLLVFSGAGLKKPMDEIGKVFKDKYGIEIQYTYAGSTQNSSQIQLSGEGDVYVPGSMYYYEVAKEKGLVDIKKDVAYHIPAIVVPNGNPANIKRLEDIAKPEVKVVLGDPKACAIGNVSMKMLEKKGIKDKVLGNLAASTATVNELVVYISMKQGDASIIWEDNAKGVPEVEIIKIPEEENMIKTIPICRIKNSSKKEIANKFIDFVVSSEGKAIFIKHGFTLID